jgi:hypothetical protein
MPEIPRSTSSRLRAMRAWIRPALATILFLITVGALAVILFLVPSRVVSQRDGLTPVERLEAESDVRTTLVQATAGLAVIGGLYFTGRTVAMTRSGQITDRFSRAVAQIGDQSPDVRIGGLYALERISLDAPSYRGVIVEVVHRYIHGRADDMTTRSARPPVDEGTVDRDVQVALTILGRRPGRERETRRLSLWGRDLPGAQLDGAKLKQADLNYARFDRTSFAGADLESAGLGWVLARSAFFTKCNLRHSSFFQSVLDGSYFSGADLTSVDFQRARLIGCDFSGRKDPTGSYRVRPATIKQASVAGADLQGTNLCGVDLRSTLGLTQEQVDVAVLDEETRLPTGLRMP